MRKRLRKLAALTGVLVMMTMSVVGCSKKVECDICGEVKKCKTETILGEKINICSDCEEALDALGSLFN